MFDRIHCVQACQRENVRISSGFTKTYYNLCQNVAI